MSWRERIADRLFGDVISARVHNAVQVVDDEYWSQIEGGAPSLDQTWTDHKAELDDALEAWRTNPMARRIVSLTTDYVVGSGITVGSEVDWVDRFVGEFWRLNDMYRRTYDWCDELTRCGELFIVLRTDPVSGASFVRALPASRMDAVETDPEDLERELRYREMVRGEVGGRWWPSWLVDPGAEQIMLHYCINRPVGCVRGTSDLSSCLRWLKRYSDWLENRARLNKYKTAFLWDVTIAGRPGRGDLVRKKRFRYKTAPEPGSIIVHDDSETWQAVSPKIDAWDAKEDGKALRLMVATGAGVPMHFLSEGEGATRATAREMGDPTFRHYYRRQLMFGHLLEDLLTVAVRRANTLGRGKVYGDLKLRIKFPDVTKGDNLEMAQSASMMARAVESMARMGIVDRETAISLILRFAGELVNIEDVLARVKSGGAVELTPVAGAGAGRPAGVATGTGDASQG